MPNEQFYQIVDKNQKLIHELPVVPDESVLFEPKKKVTGSRGRENEKSLEFLALYLYNCFAGQSNVDFQIKHLAESLNDAVARVYDVCNVFEAIGLVTKTKVKEYRWLGVKGGQFLPSLRHLKTMAEMNDLKNLFSNTSTTTLQDIAERILMLLFLPGDGLTRDQIFFLIYPEADVKKGSSCLRISKVLKILTAIGLLCCDATGNDCSKRGSTTKDHVFMYSGPRVEKFSEEEYNEFMSSKERPEINEDNDEGLDVETNSFTVVVDEANEKYFIQDSDFEAASIETVWIDVIHVEADTFFDVTEVEMINVDDNFSLEGFENGDSRGVEVQDKEFEKQDELEELLNNAAIFDITDEPINDEFVDL